MKLHRKIKHNAKVCRAQYDLGSYAQGQGHNRVSGQICVSAITQKQLVRSKFMKLHRKIKHNEKVCRAQDLGSTPKVKATVGTKVKFVSQS